MRGLGTPSKPDLHLQSATVTKFFILPKHMPTWSTNASSVDVDSAVICLTTSCPYFILTTLATQSCAPKVKWGKKNNNNFKIVLNCKAWSGGAIPAWICAQTARSSAESWLVEAVGWTQGTLCAVTFADTQWLPTSVLLGQGVLWVGALGEEEEQTQSPHCPDLAHEPPVRQFGTTALGSKGC